MMELKNLNGAVLWSGEVTTVGEAGEKAVCEGANLTDADLAGAYLTDANLRGARLSWSSHWLLSEILFRAAGDDVGRQQFAAWVGRRTDLCWEKWRTFDTPHRDWAIAELCRWVRDGDDAPQWLREIAAAKKAKGESE